MKQNLILTTALLSLGFAKAQTTIVQDTYEKNDKPVSYELLFKKQQVIICKGKKIGGLVAGSQTNNIYSYDFSGNKTPVVENEKLYQCNYSNSEKTLRVVDISNGLFKATVKYLVDGKFTNPILMDQSNAYRRYFPFYDNFTDKYEVRLTNQQNKDNIDYQKDNLNLSVVDFTNKKRKSYKLEKPNIARLTSGSFVQPDKKLGLNYRINDDDSFDFITKSIVSDYSKTTLYKTTYSLSDGKISSDIGYELNLSGKYFIYSNNGAGFTDTPANNSQPYFDDDLFINNYITDKNNGDIYVYGLYSDKPAALNKEVIPRGYYVFKFDKTGKKIWESINKIDDKDLNGKHYMYYTSTGLYFINDKLCFYAFVNEHDEYLDYGLLDKNNGNQVKASKIVFHEYESRIGVGSDFFKLDYEYKDIKELKNKKFNIMGIIAYQLNDKFANYVKSVKAKNETHFMTTFNEAGLFVVETDNDDYYKVTYFKD
ncbi:MAG: hypothetical protein QM710_09000 [Flavobacterium sp.]